MSRLYDSDYWRQRAEEARAQVSKMQDERARKALLDIAEDYDQLEEQAKQLLLLALKTPLL
jgi:hypothetical protein